MKLSNLIGITAALLSANSLSGAPARGQTKNSVDLDGLLARPVTIHVADSTLQSIAAELSRQTKVSVRVAKELGPHRIAINMRAIPAIKILEAMSELYEFEVKRSDGSISLERPTVRRPTQIQDLSKALTAAFPATYKRFLGLGSLSPKTKEDTQEAPEVQRYTLSIPLRNALNKKAGDPDPRQNAHLQMLWQVRPAALGVDHDFAYPEWTNEDRERVMLSLFYLTVARSQIGLMQALYIGLRGFELHPEQAFMSYARSSLPDPSEFEIGTETTAENGARFITTFGAPLKYLRITSPASERPP